MNCPAIATCRTTRRAPSTRACGASTLDAEPGLRIPNMLDAAVDGSFKGLYMQGEDILQSDPNTQHVAAGLAAMECVVVHDLFLNETANYAHVFLPGSTFLEKDGTFTNAERRINRVRKVMAPKNGLGDWEVTQKLANTMGLDWNYTHPSEIMDEIAATTPSFAGVYYDCSTSGLGAVALQREGAARHAGHAHRRLRARQGQVRAHRICRDRREDRAALPAAADHRPHPLASTMSARRRGAPTTCLARGGPAGDPSARRRESRHPRRRLGRASRAAPARRRCER